MPIVLQVATLQGKTVEGGRWELPSVPGLQEGQSFALSFSTTDKQLVAYLMKAQSSECAVDRDKGGYSVVLSFQVRRIRHMLTVGTENLDTMAILTPVNRSVELVLQYLLDPKKVDQKFFKTVRETVGVSPGS
jgi:hypothetical protein